MSLHHMLRAAAGNSAGPSDPNFENVTLLLTGDGTNGAQNNTFLDSSTNNFTITRNGNTTQGTFSPFSQTGWSNYFDGSGDYLTTATSASGFSFGTGDFTIEFWMYPTVAQVAYAGVMVQSTDSDPLEQRRKIGWKIMFNAVICNQNFMRRIECGSAY